MNVHPTIPSTCDIAVIGAGPAGLCLASALSAQGLRVVVLEKQPLSAIANPQPDGRDIAVTHLSRRILGEMGIWQNIPQDEVSPIEKAQVFNGGFDQHMDMQSHSEDALGFIISNHLIRKAIYDSVLGNGNITLVNETTPEDIRIDAKGAHIRLSTGENLEAKLLVIADSRFSQTREQLGIPSAKQDFSKVMMVCRMAHELPHDRTARECFLYDGWTVAVLPLNGLRSSVVITASPEKNQELAALSSEGFNAWVEEKLQKRFGKMTLENTRHSYPLVATYAARFSGPRWVLMGDAAVGMHPVTAHGFNFGLRGVRTFAESIVLAGGDPAAPAALLRYDRLHRQATRPLYLATNGIVRLYTTDTPVAKAARSMLLKGANLLSPVKGVLMKKLMEAEKP